MSGRETVEAGKDEPHLRARRKAKEEAQRQKTLAIREKLSQFEAAAAAMDASSAFDTKPLKRAAEPTSGELSLVEDVEESQQPLSGSVSRSPPVTPPKKDSMVASNLMRARSSPKLPTSPMQPKSPAVPSPAQRSGRRAQRLTDEELRI